MLTGVNCMYWTGIMIINIKLKLHFVARRHSCVNKICVHGITLTSYLFVQML